MLGLSISHWLLILVLVLVFFGKDKLPKLSRSMGAAIKNYKDAVNEIEVPSRQVSDDPALIQKQKKNSSASFQKKS